jgi:hypothetical protein
VVPPRSGKELAQAVGEALRHWARTSDKEADAAARELLVLYNEIEQDHVLTAAQRQDLHARVRNRLAQLATQISKRIARDARRSKSGPQSVRFDPSATVLGQMGGGFGQMGGGFMQPGAGGMMGPGGPANNANFDYGDDLVSLIQTTISPKSWEANGGPGTIYYWRGQHALIVRNTDEVHQDLANVLEQLNRAGH